MDVYDIDYDQCIILQYGDDDYPEYIDDDDDDDDYNDIPIISKL